MDMGKHSYEMGDIEKRIKDIEETFEAFAITVGALGTLLVEKGIFTAKELGDQYNFCLSDFDQYSAECRENGDD